MIGSAGRKRVGQKVASPDELNWDLLRRYGQVTRHRSYSEAARAIGVQRSTVGQWVLELEAEFGCKLIHRHPGGPEFALTPDGAALRRWLVVAEAHLSRLLGGQSENDIKQDDWRYVEDALVLLSHANRRRQR
ncbi:LysR family transcriptional regulator [Trinickia terrae]|uniref:LysR family transcriptional regulator n=1 Tax=Trinickia terrae TaxID=2571161 RepID=A0A4U1HVR8_9BURK|nr:LysR family transcriptional regulator [Trinickia terrae]